MSDLSLRRAVITGALSGIAEATARRMAAEGWALALVARRAEPLEALARELGAAAIVAELGDWDSATDGITRAIAALGGIDALVNCAGLNHVSELSAVSRDEWEALVGVNLTGPVAACRAALPALRDGVDAAIVNIASAQAMMPSWKLSTAYSASKGGLISFTKSLAREGGPHVRANVICPGAVETEMLVPEIRQELIASGGYTLERLGQPAEIAEAILFLASPRSSLITGTVMAVDGGRVFH